MGYLGADVVYNFGAEGSVIHEKDIEVLDVVDDKLFELVWKIEPCFLVGSVSDLGHLLVAFEFSPHSVVDTVALSPALS